MWTSEPKGSGGIMLNTKRIISEPRTQNDWSRDMSFSELKFWTAKLEYIETLYITIVKPNLQISEDES